MANSPSELESGTLSQPECRLWQEMEMTVSLLRLFLFYQILFIGLFC